MKFFSKKRKIHDLERVILTLSSCFLIILLFFIWQKTTNNVSYVKYSALSFEKDSNVKTENSKRDDWQKLNSKLIDRYKNEDYAISFLNLNNPEYTIQINADKDFVAASTYKLFAAYSMFKYGDPPSCLDTMIINSDNECPLTYLNSYGWSRLTEDAKSVGAVNSYFGEITNTTANDLTVFLNQIYNGTLLNEKDNNRLLKDMKKQIFRDGIPTGIPEATVANKVGFLDGLLHDASIIFSPKGDFILVILTDGYSWSSVANTAAEIYKMI